MLGGVCTIVDQEINKIVARTNPDLESMDQIYSHRADIFGIFSVLTFLKEYCNRFILYFDSKVKYYCDNLEIINKLNAMISISNIPNNLKVYHVKDHQDERKNKQQLFIPELLNITADKLIN